MTLWNLIRDFFVQHIFGGFSSNGDWYTQNVLGFINNSHVDSYAVDTGEYQFLKISDMMIYSGEDSVINIPQYISLGDWLSTTFTIITLVLLVIFLYIFVKWIFKLFSGLLK